MSPKEIEIITPLRTALDRSETKLNGLVVVSVKNGRLRWLCERSFHETGASSLGGKNRVTNRRLSNGLSPDERGYGDRRWSGAHRPRKLVLLKSDPRFEGYARARKSRDNPIDQSALQTRSRDISTGFLRRFRAITPIRTCCVRRDRRKSRRWIFARAAVPGTYATVGFPTPNPT